MEDQLRQLATDVGVERYQKKPTLALLQATSNAVDVTGARFYLATLRKQSEEYRDPTTKFSRHFKTKKKVQKQLDEERWQYSPEELDGGLQTAVHTGQPLRTIRGLVQLGGSVDLTVELPRAVQKWEPDLIQVLLAQQQRSARQSAIDAVLGVALEKVTRDETFSNDRETLLITLLLQAEANVPRAHFDKAVLQQQVALIGLLLRARRHVSDDCLSRNLLPAVQTGNCESVSMLLAYGGNPNPTQVLKSVTVANNYKLAVLLVAYTKHKISAGELQQCLEIVLPKAEDQKLDWLNLLFSAGADASASAVADRLQQAVRLRETAVVELLVARGAQIVHTQYNALETAIRTASDPMVALLLSVNRDMTSRIGDLLPLIQSTFADRDRLAPTRRLVEAGATGTGVHQALLELVEGLVRVHGKARPAVSDMERLDLLFQARANVDWNEGAVLGCTLQAENEAVFARLLEAGPNMQTRANALKSLYRRVKKPITTSKSSLAKSILRLGVDDIAVCKTLEDAIQYDSNNADLIHALLDQRPVQSFEDSRVLELALRKCTREVFVLILEAMGQKHKLFGEVLEKSLTDCAKAKLLLDKGCRQQDRDATLATEASKQPMRSDALQLLLSFGSSVDYDDGAGTAVSKACRSRDVSSLGLFLAANPLPATVGRALSETVQSWSGQTLHITKMLLSAKPDEQHIHEALMLATRLASQSGSRTKGIGVDSAAVDGQLALIQLLLSHGASTNFSDGQALKLAAESNELDILHLLMSTPPADRILWRVLGHAGTSIKSHEARFDAFEILLAAMTSRATELDEALIDIARQGCECVRLWVLLLDHGASVDHSDGAAIMHTIRLHKTAFLQLLLEKRPSKAVMSKAVLEAIDIRASESRLAAVGNLLETGVRSASKAVIVNRAVDDPDTDLLRLVLSKYSQPPTSTLDKAILGSLVHDIKTRLVLCKQLLEAGTVGTPAMEGVLIQAVRDEDTELLSLALRHNKSPGTLSFALSTAMNRAQEPRLTLAAALLQAAGKAAIPLGDALDRAVYDQDLDLIHLIISYHPLVGALSRALLAVMDYAPSLRIVVAEVLLDAGAQGPELDAALNRAGTQQDLELVCLILRYHKRVGIGAADAIVKAARLGNLPMLTALMAQTGDPAISSRAYQAMTDAKTVRNVATGFACADLLLDRGVEQQCLDTALIDTVADAVGGRLCQKYIDTLLAHSADVNASDGECVRTAARAGQSRLFEQLVDAGASSRTLIRALPLLFGSGIEEYELVELMRLCFMRTSNAPGADRNAASKDQLTYLSLVNYPSGRLVLECLLEHGYDIQWTRQLVLSQQTGEEKVNALIWAQSSGNGVSPEVLRLLVPNVEVNFAARSSGVTALMLAASNDTTDLIDTLILHDAELDTKSKAGKTALSYASENGSTNAVRQLCHRARLNDGSIQDAARELHPGIVEALLQAGHDPNFPSDIHEGRSALLEMLLYAQILTPDKCLRLDRTLSILRKAGADSKIEFEGKTALFCALANSHSFDIVSSLLDTDEWKALDADHNIYKDAFGRCYSATMYIEHGLWQGPSRDQQRLLGLLRRKRCKDRYYKLNGEQPEGARNPPEDIAQQQRARDAVRDQHRLQLELSSQSHVQDMRQQQDRHALTLGQNRELEADKILAGDNRHSQSMRHNKELALQRQTTLRHENQALLTHTQGMNRLAAEHQQKMILQRQSENEHKMVLERQLLEEQESAGERESRRKMRAIDRADESMKLRNRLMLSQAEAQREIMQLQSSASPYLLRDSESPD